MSRRATCYKIDTKLSIMIAKKQFLKSKPVCKVTFKAPAALVEGAKKVQVVGNYNDWDVTTGSLKALKSGDFSGVVVLPSGENIEYKFLVDGDKWLTDPEAEAAVANEFGEENSIVSTVQ